MVAQIQHNQVTENDTGRVDSEDAASTDHLAVLCYKTLNLNHDLILASAMHYLERLENGRCLVLLVKLNGRIGECNENEDGPQVNLSAESVIKNDRWVPEYVDHG